MGNELPNRECSCQHPGFTSGRTGHGGQVSLVSSPSLSPVAFFEEKEMCAFKKRTLLDLHTEYAKMLNQLQRTSLVE